VSGLGKRSDCSVASLDRMREIVCASQGIRAGSREAGVSGTIGRATDLVFEGVVAVDEEHHVEDRTGTFYLYGLFL
jgi:hypothetical protein